LISAIGHFKAGTVDISGRFRPKVAAAESRKREGLPGRSPLTYHKDAVAFIAEGGSRVIRNRLSRIWNEERHC
jgi:hypothetical protein